MEEASRNVVHFSLFQIWQKKRRPSWVFSDIDPNAVFLSSILYTTTHVGRPEDSAAICRLVAARHNYARVAANLPALTLEDVLAVPLKLTVDASVLDPTLSEKSGEAPTREDREVVAERVLSALDALVRLCGSPAWQFDLVVGGGPGGAGSFSQRVGALVSGCLAPRGLASCRVIEAGPEGHTVAAAQLALAEPRLRVLLASSSTEHLWATRGASGVLIPDDDVSATLPGRIAQGKLPLQLIENRSTALMTWDATGPTSYDAAMLCGGGRSSLHSPARCFMMHFAAGEGLKGVFVFEDVSCDACGAGLNRKTACHDYFFCLPCNWAACGPCFRAADKTAAAGERPPRPPITRIASPEAEKHARDFDAAHPGKAQEMRARLKEALRSRGISFLVPETPSAGAPPHPVSPEACAECAAPCGEGGSPLQRCSRCRSVAYCGPACQRAHWKQHKGACMTAACMP